MEKKCAILNETPPSFIILKKERISCSEACEANRRLVEEKEYGWNWMWKSGTVMGEF